MAPNEKVIMKSNSVILVYRTGDNPMSGSANASVAVKSLDVRVNPATRISSVPNVRRGGLAALHNDWREGELQETVIFGILGMCGGAGMILAVVRIAAG